ncbi:MAG: YtxH domain-containing protein [Niabella sp.]
MKDRNKILLGILGAAAAGVAIGLLFYTDEGKKTRKKIKHTTQDWADSLGSLIASGKENFSDMKHKAVEKAKSRYNKFRSKAEDEYENFKEDLAEKSGKLADNLS